jgi:hypothetical protein
LLSDEIDSEEELGGAIVSSDGTLGKMLLSRLRVPGVTRLTDVQCWFRNAQNAQDMGIKQLEDAKAANLLEQVYIDLQSRGGSFFSKKGVYWSWHPMMCPAYFRLSDIVELGRVSNRWMFYILY